jgi:ribosome-associated heat shock protein Hsp15
VKVDKSSATVRRGDVLTLSLGPRVISIEILGIGLRRGPAPEAQALYRDLTPKPPPGTDALREVSDSAAFATPPQAVRAEGGGRPTKRERRQIDKFRGRE